MNLGWYFSEELSPSDELVDKFADSKFGVDKWTSFTREIIQNSLDARDDDKSPVEMNFDLNKNLRITDIPGGYDIKDVLERCKKKATNSQTKQAYNKGLEILNRENIYCLKVSDYNTRGVESGRDNAWGAFVFDEGKSVKQRPGSAGSHGVGKKVPFIISTCNTVFYSTKNKYTMGSQEKSDTLVQGKTTLINWEDKDGIRRNPKGWFGKLTLDNKSPKDKIQPISNEETTDINPYFVRKDRYGTDVTIIGINAYDNEEELKRAIISSILENFFVAIKENKLIVTVFGEKFHSGDLDKLKKWYEPSNEVLKNSINDLLRIYSYEPDILPINLNDETIGEVHIYFEDSSESNRKYYTVVRDHGMTIKEYRINRADKAYSALVIIRGEKLNELLSKLENAAHNDFITEDEDMDLDKDAIKALQTVQRSVEKYIIEKTKIDDGEDQVIEGLQEILAIPGFTPKITKKDLNARIKKTKVKKKKKKQRIPKPEPTPSPTPNPSPEPNPEPKKKKEKVEREYNSFAMEPVLIKTEGGYILRAQVNHDMKSCEFRIHSINSDEKIDNSIADVIVSASDDWRKYKVQNGCISKIKIKKDQPFELKIKTSREVRYRLVAELWYKE